VERRFAELTNRKPRRSAHRSVIELEADIRRSINEWNKDPRPGEGRNRRLFCLGGGTFGGTRVVLFGRCTPSLQEAR
jgi:hypothetical protein